MNITYHESLYRSQAAMDRVKQATVTVCGAGALGANLSESLVRCGLANLHVIDKDRVEQHNLGTQPYETDDVGARKADTLGRALYRAVGVEVTAVAKELTGSNVAKLLAGDGLVVDCFDNSLSRRIVADHCLESGIPCLHVGLADGYAEVIWNEHYRVPSGRWDDICDYPLARNLVTLAVSVACEVVLRYLIKGERSNWSVTLEDLAIRPLDM